MADVQAAAVRLDGSVYLSPCPRSQTLSERLGCDLFLKLENLQMTGSFKERGARNRLLQLSEVERAAGVFAASAGNHAQGVAYVARELGIAALIVMPVSTPLVKVERTRSFGAEVVLHGRSYAEAHQRAVQLGTARGMTEIPAFDDDAVIAGQGTVGTEIVQQVPEVDAVVAPVGGGGLLAGLSVALRGLRPKAQLYGVEPASMPSMAEALSTGTPVSVSDHATLADGIAVRRVSQRTLSLVRDRLAGLVSVDDEEIAEAVLVLLENEKTVAEGAGAAPLAALLQRRIDLAGKRVVIVLTGGNIDVNLVARIIDRGLRKSGRAVRLSVLLPDVPGSLVGLLKVVADCQANVLQVVHDRLDLANKLGDTSVALVLETRGFEHVQDVRAALAAAGYRLLS